MKKRTRIFNILKVGESVEGLGDKTDRCRKANHYWKRHGRKFVVTGEGAAQLLTRIK